MAKLALEFTSPLNLLAFRFVGAFLILTPFIVLMRLKLPNMNTCWGLMATGLFLQIGHFGSIYVGLKLGASASIMALFAASQPVLVIISAALLARKMPSWQVWAALMLGLGGAVIIVGVDTGTDQGYVLGAFLGFTAVVGLSIGQVIEKQRKLNVHPIMATWIQYAFAGAISTPFALAIEGLVFDASFPLPFVFSIAYLTIVNSVIGIMLMLSMVRTGSVSQVASIMFLVPAVGALIAWLVVDEVPKLLMIPGFILAMIGAVWTKRLSARKQP